MLSALRSGDYAHAGETEAIEIALHYLVKNPNRLLLDVGSGLGGTAHYVEEHGWGKVVGVDIDNEVLEYSKTKYPEIEFKHCNAESLHQCFKKAYFDVIYSFNAFFSFISQENCLASMSEVAKKGAELILFDYSSPVPYSKESPFYDHTGKSSSQYFKPIDLSSIEENLNKTSWHLVRIMDLTDKYIIWYQWLITQMEKRKKELISQFGDDLFDDLYGGYCRLLDLLQQERVGGAVVQAEKT